MSEINTDDSIKPESEDSVSGVDPIELRSPDILTIFAIVVGTLKKLKDKTAVILWSSIVLLVLWGMKGNADMIFPKKWREALFPDLVWRDQLVSFITGFILLVVIPCCIVKFFFKEKLSDYGLGWPKDRIKLGIIGCFVLMVVCVPIFYSGTGNAEMQAEYPMFGKFEDGSWRITTWGGFIVYELVYFIFFINIEFIFRGYLLFGLFSRRAAPGEAGTDAEASPAPPASGPVGFGDMFGYLGHLFRKKGDKEISGKNRLIKDRLQGVYGLLGRFDTKRVKFGVYAILFQMLAYTMWHLAKPTPEYMGTLGWGVAVAAIALACRSIWPVIIVHWALNVFIDTVLWLR